MSRPLIENARRSLMLWCGALVLLAALIEVVDFGLRAHARERRKSDYRTYLAAAEDLRSRYDYPAALAQVEEAKRRGPKAPEPYALAGHIRYQMKYWSQAITEYQEAIARGSQDEGVILNVVWALIELNRYEEAAAVGIKALNAGFSMPALPRYIAEADFRAGKLPEAIPYYEKALNGYPNDLYLLDHLRQAYRAAGQMDKAKQIQTRIADIEASLNAAP
jgi:tetratricopeptide (TPR) repeat protein